MQSRLFVIPVTLLMLSLAGCSLSVNDAPYTFAEKHLYDEGYLEDPHVKCELGYQKIYYVINNKSELGGNNVLAFTNCLTAEHVAKLKVLSTGPQENSIESLATKSDPNNDQVLEIIEAFRTPLPDLSAR